MPTDGCVERNSGGANFSAFCIRSQLLTIRRCLACSRDGSRWLTTLQPMKDRNNFLPSSLEPVSGRFRDCRMGCSHIVLDSPPLPVNTGVSKAYHCLLPVPIQDTSCILECGRENRYSRSTELVYADTSIIARASTPNMTIKLELIRSSVWWAKLCDISCPRTAATPFSSRQIGRMPVKTNTLPLQKRPLVSTSVDEG